MSGYIKLDRKLFEHWLWNTNEPYTKGQAWIDLIQLANYIDRSELYRGRLYDRKRGQVNCSELWLADRWKWSRGKVSRFLALLIQEKMIQVVGTTNGTTITIENYDNYQDGSTASETVSETPNRTSDGHTRNKEIKENKYIYIIEHILTYLNGVTGKRFSPKTEAYIKLINARLDEGYTIDDFKKVIDNKYADWKGTKYETYLRPQTLFAKSHFDDYLNSTPRKKTSGNPFLDILETMID